MGKYQKYLESTDHSVEEIVSWADEEMAELEEKLALAKSTNDLSSKNITAFMIDSNEQAAHIERLREEVDYLGSLRSCDCGHPVCSRCQDTQAYQDVLAETPKQSLTHIKQDAIREMLKEFDILIGQWVEMKGDYFHEYADKLEDK